MGTFADRLRRIRAAAAPKAERRAAKTLRHRSHVWVDERLRDCKKAAKNGLGSIRRYFPEEGRIDRELVVGILERKGLVVLVEKRGDPPLPGEPDGRDDWVRISWAPDIH